MQQFDRAIVIVGMNAVGKSSFGKQLASKLRFNRIDTDIEFRKLYGPEQEYIKTYGWEAFRKIEESIVLTSLHPGHVVVLGGGAVETEGVRSALKQKAIVLWIQAGHKTVHRHLHAAKVVRPEFATRPDRSEVKELMESRVPLYQEVADICIESSVKFRDRVETAVRLLRAFQTKR